MKHSLVFIASALAAVLLLPGGCVNLSPRPDGTRFFVLGALPETGKGPVAPGQLYFARPEIPAYMRSEKMVYRTAGGELKPVGGHRWAEPLDEGVARALAQAWAERTGKVPHFFPWARTDPSGPAVRVRLYEFGGDDRGRVVLEAAWQVTGASVPASGRFTSQVEGWPPGDPGALVAALNALLEGLAAEIARESPFPP